MPYRKQNSKQNSSKSDMNNAHVSIDQNIAAYHKQNRKQNSSKSDMNNTHVSMKTFPYLGESFLILVLRALF